MRDALGDQMPEDDNLGDPIKLRPLPKPPRCRGIPIGDGNYTGCLYGWGEVPPFHSPVDCPICNGSGIEGGFTPD